MRFAIWTTALLLLATQALAAAPDYPLRISGDGRHVLDASGEEILFHAESGWHLMMRLTREEALLYLDDRKAKGFDAILVMLMVAEGYHGTSANAYGEGPFLSPGDFSQPNEAYFAHVDWVLDRAQERDLTIFLAPCYTGYACGNQGWCAEMKAAGTSAMRDWGRWVGNRYRNQPNIVWVNGGDADASAHGAADVVDAVAQGIREVDDQHLHTAHCNRYNSGADCYDRPWLDINTSYADCQRTARKIRDDYFRSPTRPYVFIEGRYEEEHDWTDQCIRGQAYAAILGGAVGHFFGHGDIWGFFNGWEPALQSTGSRSMEQFQRLIRSRTWELLEPDYAHDVVTSGYGNLDSDQYVSAARTVDGNTVIAYLPTSRTITVDMTRIGGDRAIGWWFDPANGALTDLGTLPNTGALDFTPPGSGDWVLVLDNASAGFDEPGRSDSGTPVLRTSWSSLRSLFELDSGPARRD